MCIRDSLTIFSVAVAIGSGLAAWLAHGRIILLPTLVGAVLLGVFALDLGWTASSIVHSASPLGIAAYFASDVYKRQTLETRLGVTDSGPRRFRSRK